MQVVWPHVEMEITLIIINYVNNVHLFARLVFIMVLVLFVLQDFQPLFLLENASAQTFS